MSINILPHPPSLKQAPSIKRADYSIPGYFASPIDLYLGPQIYTPALTIAQKQFPDIDFIEPALMDWNNAEWLRDWVQIAPNLGLITVLPRLDRSIGMGCHKEIADSLTLGIPIYIFDYDTEAFSPFSKQIRLPFKTRTPYYFARAYSHSPAPKGSDIK